MNGELHNAHDYDRMVYYRATLRRLSELTGASERGLEALLNAMPKRPKDVVDSRTESDTGIPVSQ